jgi:peroxiredoxin
MTILHQAFRWLGANKKMTHIMAGNTAPDFSLAGLDGNEYSLENLTQQGPVVAAFFKVSCPVCQFTFPFLERLFKRYGGGGVTFLGISQDDTGDTKEFAKEFGVTFPMALDEKKKGYPASNAYGLTMVPTIFLIEPGGEVKVSCMGFDKKDLESIGAALAERKKIEPAVLFRPNESVPASKPG